MPNTAPVLDPGSNAQPQPPTIDFSKLPDQPEPQAIDFYELSDQPDPQIRTALANERILNSLGSEACENPVRALQDYRFNQEFTYQALHPDPTSKIPYIPNAVPGPLAIGAPGTNPAETDMPLPSVPTGTDYQDLTRNASSNSEVWSALYGKMVVDALQRLYAPNDDVKTANIMALAHRFGASPNLVADNYDAYNTMANDDVSTRRLWWTMGPMLGGTALTLAGQSEGLAAWAAVGNELKGLGLGIAGMQAEESTNAYIRSRIQGTPYSQTQPYGLHDLLPDQASEDMKGAIDLLDMIAKFKVAQIGTAAAGKATYQGLNNLWDAMAYDKVSQITPAQRFYIPADEIMKFYGTSTEGSAGQYYDILQKLNLYNDTVRQAAKNGIDVEVPLSGVVSATDAPWWGAIKSKLKMTPYESETKIGGGPPTATVRKPGAPAPEGQTEGTLSAQAETGQAKPALLPEPGTEIVTGPWGDSSPSQSDQTEPQVPTQSVESDGIIKTPVGCKPPPGLTVQQEADLVTRSIGLVESRNCNLLINNNWGEYGGLFQYAPRTWTQYSTEYNEATNGGDSAMGMTPQNQYEVTKFKVQQWLSAGYSPSQVASIWNAGEGHPDWAEGVGHNEKTGEDYDVPHYVDKFQKAYSELSGQPMTPARIQVVGAIQTNPNIPPEQKTALIDQLEQRAQFIAERDEGTPEEWYDRYIFGNDAPQVGEGLTKQPWQMTQDEYIQNVDQKFSISDALRDSHEHRGRVTGLDMARDDDAVNSISQLCQYIEEKNPERAQLAADALRSQYGGNYVTSTNQSETALGHLHQNEQCLFKYDYFSGLHEKSVLQAVSKGKPVPPEILSDYPDLKDRVQKHHPDLLAKEQKSAIVSEPEASYVEESKRVRKKLKKQGQINAFSGANVPSSGPRPASSAPAREEQKSSLDAFTTIGKAFRDIERKPVQIIGQKVKSFADVAVLAQRWRNPNYEEFRYIFLKDDEIVDHEGVTCRTPGCTAALMGYTRAEQQGYIEHIKDRLKALGSDALLLLHNHPSGNPKASPADVNLTKILKAEIPEVQGHIIINSGKYGLLMPDGEFSLRALKNLPADWEDPVLQPSVPHEYLGKSVSRTDAVAGWAKAITKDRNLPVLIYLDADNHVRGLQELHPEALTDYNLMLQAMPRKLLDFGCRGSIVSLPDDAPPEMIDSVKRLVAAHVFWDAVGRRADGSTYSFMTGCPDRDFLGGRQQYSFGPERLFKERQAEFSSLLATLKSGEPDAAAAALERKLSGEATQRANPIYRLNGEYDKALAAGEKQAGFELHKKGIGLHEKGIEPRDQLQAEAARRAGPVIVETEAAVRRKFETALRKKANAMWDQEPGPKAVEELKSGGINHEALAKDYDKDSVTKIARRWPGLVEKNGYWGLDDAAASYGFASADHLFRLLLDHPAKTAYVERFVTEGMKYHENDIALTALERHAILVDQELELMLEAWGAGTSPADVIPEGMSVPPANPAMTGLERMIEKQVGLKKAQSLEDKTNYDNLKAAIQISARNAKAAYREGKLDEALRQKIRQKNLVTNLRVEMDARQEANKLRTGISRIIRQFAKAKGFDPVFLDAAIDLIRPFARPLGFGRKLVNYRNVSTSVHPLRDAFAKATGNGELVPVDVEDLYTLKGKSPKDVDVDDLRDVHTAVTMLYHFAGIENQALSLHRAASFQDLIYALVQSGLASAGGRGEGGGERLQAKAAGELAASATTKYWLSIGRTEFLNRDLDGWKGQGPHFEAVTQPLQDGTQAFLTLKDEIDARYLAAHKAFEEAVGMCTEKWFRQKVTIPGMAGPITRDRVWGAYSCLFNEANLRAVRSIFNAVQLAHIRGLVTPAEQQLFLAHVAQFAALKDELWDLNFEMAGVYPKEVEGVYWPIKIDPDLNVQSEAFFERSATQDLWKTAFDGAAPPSPFNKARKGALKPADLTYTWILPRLHQQAKWMSMAKPLRDVQRIVSNPDWMNMVINTRGRAWWDQYMPQLRDIANPRRNMPTGGLEQLIATARKVDVLHTLGGNLMTAVKHHFEWMPGANKSGLTNCLRGFISFYGSIPFDAFNSEPTAFTDINKESLRMAHATHSHDLELQNFQAALQGYPPFTRRMLLHCLDLLKLSDIFLRYPLYLEAKAEALEGRGKSGKELVSVLGRLPTEAEATSLPASCSLLLAPRLPGRLPTEAEAIAHAEAAVGLTKPVACPDGLPLLGRTPGCSRLFFTFGTYFNGVLNNLQKDYPRWGYDPDFNFYHFSKALFLLLVLTPLLTESAVHAPESVGGGPVAYSLRRESFTGGRLRRAADPLGA